MNISESFSIIDSLQVEFLSSDDIDQKYTIYSELEAILLPVYEDKKLYEIYEEQHKQAKLTDNLADAYIKLNLSNQLKQTYDHYETNKKIATLKSKYLVQQTEYENEILQRQISKSNRERTFLFILSGLLSLILIGSYKLWQRNKYWNLYLEEKVFEQTQEIRAHNKSLSSSNTELKQFGYIASHDIKEPIRNIGAFVKLIEHKISQLQRHEMSQYFRIINDSIKQLYSLIDDITQFSNLSEHSNIKLEDVHLNDIMKQVTESLDHFLLNRNAIIQVDNLGALSGNKTLLFLIFKNIIENGIKYNVSDQPIIKITHEQTDSEHIITIKDNGIGIKEEDKDKIFGIFQRLHSKDKYEGTGLGLSIVESSISKLGGTIQVNSVVDEGSEFSLNFPAQKSA